jgi:hypothetical protein
LKHVLKEGRHVWLYFLGAEEARQPCLPCSLISAAIREFLGHDAALLARDLLYIDIGVDGSVPLHVRFMHEKLDTGVTGARMPDTREQRAKLNLPDFALKFLCLRVW